MFKGVTFSSWSCHACLHNFSWYERPTKTKIKTGQCETTFSSKMNRDRSIVTIWQSKHSSLEKQFFNRSIWFYVRFFNVFIIQFDAQKNNMCFLPLCFPSWHYASTIWTTTVLTKDVTVEHAFYFRKDTPLWYRAGSVKGVSVKKIPFLIRPMHTQKWIMSFFYKFTWPITLDL